MQCYPEGNFGRNQLLDGSIGLSPLYRDVKIDLHVRTFTGFHQRFLLASPSPGIAHHLSGLMHDANLDGWLRIEPSRRSSVKLVYSRHTESPWSVFQDGSDITTSQGKPVQLFVNPVGFPIANFRFSFTPSQGSFSTFPHGTCSLSHSGVYLLFGGMYHQP